MNGRMARWLGGLFAALVLMAPGAALAQYGIFVPDPGVPAALSVTSSSSRVALAGTSATTVITNTGSVNARCKFGDASVTAATTDSVITAGMSRAYGTGGTYLACITATGTTSIVAETGSGVAAFGGGGSSGGGGGAVTVASGADVVEGATTDTSATNTVFGNLQALKAAAQDTSTESPVKIADGSDASFGAKALSACSTDNGTCTLIELIKRLNQRLTTLDTDVNTLNTSVNSSVPAGTNEAMNLVKDTHAQCGALCANLVVKNSAGKLKTFEVSADSTLAAAIWYVILYDATAAPTDGAITPAKCYQQPAGSTQMGGTLSAGGSSFTTGITIGVSTTGCFTKTASTHAFIGADYQ
jgi:hypothetical protein